MKLEVINSIARDYQLHMNEYITMHMKGVQKLLRLTHIISLDQDLGGSTLHCMILVGKICNTPQCLHLYHILIRAGYPYPAKTMIGASTGMNVGSQQPKVHLDFRTRLDQMVLLHPPRVCVGIASLGLTPTLQATWQIRNRFGPS